MHQEYAAQAFHPQFANGRASGTLVLSEDCVIFYREDVKVQLPLDGLQLKLGGAGNRLVFISHPQYPEWNLYTSDRSLLNHPTLQAHASVKLQAEAVRRKHWLGLGIFGGILATLIALPLCILLFMDAITGWIAPSVPAEWERQLGETAFAQYRLGKTFLDTPEAKASLESLVAPLVNADIPLRHPLEFHIARSEEVNAFALPGGIVVINSALILEADNADQVLGVLAHEISHVSEQHSIRSILSTGGIYLVVQALLGDVTGLFATLANAAPLLINQSYSRDFERDADVKGVELLVRAHIDPAGLPAFFKKMKKIEEDMLKQIENEKAREVMKNTQAFLGTHPATDERIETLNKLIAKEHNRYLDMSDEFSHLKSQIKTWTSEREKPKP